MLNLGHVLSAAGIDPVSVVVLRHTYKSMAEDGITSATEATPAKVLEYTRRQGASKNHKLGKVPPALWLIFLEEPARRGRYFGGYVNHGEVLTERTEALRFFDLEESDALAPLRDRLVIEWSSDAINWAKKGQVAADFPVVEIADPARVDFPGFDRVLLTYSDLQAVVSDSRWRLWQSALSAVQGIYLIADTSNGKLYVGKADGEERVLGRWSAYARDGHGGNMALKELAGLDPSHKQNFVFSLLRVFGPEVPLRDVNAAESHYKEALLSRSPHGYNKN